MKKRIGILAAVLLIAVGVYYFVPGIFGISSISGTPSVPVSANLNDYESADYGIVFAYPDSYIVSEVKTDGTGGHEAVITLMDKVAMANIPVGGEGPTSITFDVFKADEPHSSVKDWIENTPRSNFNLSIDKSITELRVAGAPAYSYSWDGLYGGRSIAFEHKSMIIVASVTMFAPSDRIVSDFEALIATLELK